MKVMKYTAIVAAAFIVLAGLAAPRSHAAGKEQTLTGEVSDYMCGLKHTMLKGADDKKCTLACIKMGSKYSFVVGKNYYQLEGSAKDLEKLAGGPAKISGIIDGKKIKVSSISAP